MSDTEQEMWRRIKATKELIVKCKEQVAASPTPPPFEVLANIQTLERLRDRLQVEVVFERWDGVLRGLADC